MMEVVKIKYAGYLLLLGYHRTQVLKLLYFKV